MDNKCWISLTHISLKNFYIINEILSQVEISCDFIEYIMNYISMQEQNHEWHFLKLDLYYNLARIDSLYHISRCYKGINLNQRVQLLSRALKSYDILLKAGKIDQVQTERHTMIESLQNCIDTQIFCYDCLKNDLRSLIVKYGYEHLLKQS